MTKWCYWCSVVLVSVAFIGLAVAQWGDPAVGPQGRNVPESHNMGTFFGAVTFETLNLAPGTQIDPNDGVPMTVEGFTFTPGPNNDSGLNDSHYGNAVDFWGYNGTHVMFHHDDVIMTEENGAPFDLFAFDFCGFPPDAEIAFTVTGQPGNLVANFTPDGFVDGPGGRVDFQTFVLPPSFQNLTSVTFEHSGGETNAGLFGLDNLQIVTVATEPSTWGKIKALYNE